MFIFKIHLFSKKLFCIFDIDTMLYFASMSFFIFFFYLALVLLKG